MIVELRIYTTYVGKAAEYVRLYEAEGLPIQRPVQGELLGMYQTEFGPMNEVIVLWRYADEARWVVLIHTAQVLRAKSGRR